MFWASIRLQAGSQSASDEGGNAGPMSRVQLMACQVTVMCMPCRTCWPQMECITSMLWSMASPTFRGKGMSACTPTHLQEWLPGACKQRRAMCAGTASGGSWQCTPSLHTQSSAVCMSRWLPGFDSILVTSALQTHLPWRICCNLQRKKTLLSCAANSHIECAADKQRQCSKGICESQGGAAALRGLPREVFCGPRPLCRQPGCSLHDGLCGWGWRQVLGHTCMLLVSQCSTAAAFT